MRLLQMLSAAAQAEGIVLRREMRGVVRQAAWIAVAGVFGVAGLVAAHVAVVAYLRSIYGMPIGAAMVAAGDLVIAGVLLFFAKPRVDPVAEEARALRGTMLSAIARGGPVSNALGFALQGGPAKLFGVVVGEAVAAWLRRR